MQGGSWKIEVWVGIMPCIVSIERPETAPLTDWLQSHGIRAVLFDLDDTLLDTSTFVRAHEKEYIDYCSQMLPHISREDLAESYRVADVEAYGTDSVHRSRWDTIVRSLGKKYGDTASNVFSDGQPILMRMYDEMPDVFPGARETLDAFRFAAVKIGVVTHADEDIANKKLDLLDLRNYFHVVQIADAKGSKTSNDWKAAIDALGVRPEETLVVGDNIVGDIQAAMNAGVKYAVALPSPWQLFDQKDIPKETLRANTIRDVIPVLLSTFR